MRAHDAVGLATRRIDRAADVVVDSHAFVVGLEIGSRESRSQEFGVEWNGNWPIGKLT